MARIRSIKPEFFLHEDLAELSPAHRLLFIGLWTLADREGRLEDRPKRIKAALFPWDDCDVDAMLGELAEGGFVVRYEAQGVRGVAIPAFTKHQKPHVREASSEIPPPPGHHPDASRRATHQGDAEHQAKHELATAKEAPEHNLGNASAPPRSDRATAKATPSRAVNGSGNGEWIGEGESEGGDAAASPSPPRSPGRRAKRGKPKRAASDIGARVLARMNELAGKDFRYSPQLEARIAEGVGEADLLLVVETQWRRPYMRQNREYFRPKTLFGPENFEEYRGAAGGSGSPSTAGPPHRPPEEDGYRYVFDDDEPAEEFAQP